MKCNQNSIKSILQATATTYVVPPWQRLYDWENEQCERLFLDIKEVADKIVPWHDLQDIMVNETNNGSQSEIIDGQQRMTTITLMLKAMHDFLIKINDCKIAQEYIADYERKIQEYLYHIHNNKENGTICRSSKMHLKKINEEQLQIILSDDISTHIKDVNFANCNIYLNYQYFLNAFEEYGKEVGQMEAVEKILDALEKVKVFWKTMEEGECAHRYFERLNCTGKKLTVADQLCSYFLSGLDNNESTYLYNNYWSAVEKLIPNAEHRTRFLMDYLILVKKSNTQLIPHSGKRKVVSEKSLYELFKVYLTIKNTNNGKTTFDNAENLLKELKYYAEIYHTFLFEHNTEFKNNFTDIERSVYFLSNSICIKSTRILLLYFFDLYKKNIITTEELQLALDELTALVVRTRMCNNTKIEIEFVANFLYRMSNKDFNKIKFIDALRSDAEWANRSPSDEEFKQAFTKKNIYKEDKTFAKYLLYHLNQEMYRKKSLNCSCSFDSSLSVEHIIPQKLNKHWEDKLHDFKDEYEEVKHTIGNLTLAHNKNNSKLQNDSFEEKRLIYTDSAYIITRELRKMQDFGINEVKERTIQLANLAVDIWKAHLTKEMWTQQELYRFQDYKQLNLKLVNKKNIRPASLNIEKTVYNVNTWPELTTEVCKEFLQKDYCSFVRAIKECNRKTIQISEKPLPNERFLKVFPDKNIYIERNKNYTDCLRMLTRLTDAYDKEAQTNYGQIMQFSLS